MKKREVSRQQIIEQSLQVFRRQGYHGTAMADLAAACGLLKGSFYYHFDSKEALLLAVLDHMNQYFEQQVFPLAYVPDTPPQQRLLLMFGRLQTFYGGDLMPGCIMGNLTLETASQANLPFLPAIRRYFDGWIAALSHLLQTQYQPAQAQAQARRLVQDYEGALLMVRLYGDPSPVADTVRRALALFDEA